MVQIDWQKTPLIPVIAQEAETGEVLMLAYANEEAYTLTLSSGYAHYYSRSRQRLWKKGEQSGHLQQIETVQIDCDGDALLYRVKQSGPACHTGRKSCFFTDAKSSEATEPVMTDPLQTYGIVESLYHTILERKGADAKSSYVASLFAKGDNAIVKKVVEEAGELAFAIKDSDEQAIVSEAADLLFHTLVALGHRDITPDRIRQELARRQGLSGLEEKRQRNSN
jgi:phosphoribosyl-ATP pyrophosphohydrolase/phosphoribosyl-AMP cyclohydrolase